MDIGKNIKDLRFKNGLTQEELADRCELTKGYISQIERNLTSPSISTLIDILDCLGTDLNNFFSKEENDKIVYTEEDYFVKNFDDDTKINWLISNSQKYSMEPILLELKSGGKTKIDSPHNGEEFGYVLKGIITLNYDGKKYKLKKGQSFYYPCNKDHYIENNGKYDAEVIWISSPPYF
ncbi:MAG: cupin domain-containing protein [Bacillota bacterium]|nr:cupin domain-containing protein [Bacillota bacterium]